MAPGPDSRCGESGCGRQRQQPDEESRALGNARDGLAVHGEGSAAAWKKDTDGVNSLLCGPANALKPPPLVKPVITRAPLIKNETEEKQWANWGRRAL